LNGIFRESTPIGFKKEVWTTLRENAHVPEKDSYEERQRICGNRTRNLDKFLDCRLARRETQRERWSLIGQLLGETKHDSPVAQ
jgi:hypothetical protein